MMFSNACDRIDARRDRVHFMLGKVTEQPTRWGDAINLQDREPLIARSLKVQIKSVGARLLA